MGPIGGQEMIFIFLLALLLFGPKKLPELGRMLGKGLTEFRRAKNELKSTFETHMQELEREARSSEKPEKPKWDQPSTTPSQYSSASYPYPYDEYGRNDVPSSSQSSSNTFPIDNAPDSSGEPVPSAPVAGTVPRFPASAPAAPEPVSTASEHERSA